MKNIMGSPVGMEGICQELVKELNDIYFPNGTPLITEDKKRELLDYIEKKFREIEEKIMKGGEEE